MKQLLLGTSLWGWSIQKDVCFKLLDLFYSEGFRMIDTANNYPLNGKSEDYRLAENIIAEWISVHGVNDLSIIYKVGSLSNMRDTTINLSATFLQREYSRIFKKFGQNIGTVMIHWDNRFDLNEITDSIKCLCSLPVESIGLSGITNPDLHSQAFSNLNYKGDVFIQAKYNFKTHDLSTYQPLSNLNTKMIAYGISVSGLKLKKSHYNKTSYVRLARSESYHEENLTKELSDILNKIINSHHQINSIYDVGLLFSEASNELWGYIVAPSKIDHLLSIINLLDLIKNGSINPIEIVNIFNDFRPSD